MPPINVPIETEKTEHDLRLVGILSNAMRTVFGENEDAKRFIDVSRIPLICKSIIDIHENVKELKSMMESSHEKFVNQDQFRPISLAVYGLCGLILTGFIGAVITLVLRN